MDLKLKIAIITGASSGLGRALSKAIIREEGIVYGIARNKEKLIELQHELGGNFIPVVLDVTDSQYIQEWIKDTFQQQIPDILINNAGMGGFGKIDDMSMELWTSMIDTNLKGMYYITAALVPLLKIKNSSCHIVNIGSIMGTTTNGEATAYSASKFAVNGFSQALFKELRGDNIKVTCVNPGSIATDFFVNSGIKSNSNMLKPVEVADTIIHILKTPDNVLIDQITLRPLMP